MSRKLIILSIGRDIANSAQKLLNRSTDVIFQKPEIRPFD
jgi:hypothetical protein